MRKNTKQQTGLNWMLGILFIFLFGVSNPSYASLIGVYTIDSSLAASSTNYKNFTSAVNDMRYGTRTDGGTPNGSGISGAVRFNVAAGYYSEQIELTGITGINATNTITFDGGNGNASTRVIAFSGATSTTNGYTIRINGLQYVTIRNISILAASASYGWPLHIMGLANNTNINNCIIGFTTLASTHTFSNYCALVINNSTSNPTTGSIAFSNISIDSNTIYGGYGNYIYGSGAANNINVRYNSIDSSYNFGLYISGTNKSTLYNNRIRMNENGNLYSYGIFFNSNNASATNKHDIIGNTIQNAGYFGVYLSSSSGYSDAVRSNLINNVIGGGFRSTNASGIYIASNSYNWNIYHNSVNLDALTSNSGSAALYVGNCCTTGATLLDIRNNILAVTKIGSSAYAFYFPNGYYYAVKDTGALNNNLYYKAGTNNLSPLAYSGGITLTASNIIGNSGYNKASIVNDPSFISNTNLAIKNPCFNGAVISSVTTDITGATRSATSPDIGAYELNGIPNDIGVSTITTPAIPFNAGTQDITVVIKNYGSNAVTSANVYYSINGGTPVMGIFSGNIPACGSANYTFTGSQQYNFVANTAYTIKVYTALPNNLVDTNNVNDTLSIPLIYAGLAGNYTIDQSQGASSTNFPSFTAAVNALNNGGVSGAVTFTVMGNTPYNEQVSLENVYGTSATNTITFDGGNGNAANRILTFAATQTGEFHTIRVNNTPYVTIKNLTVRGTGSIGAWPIHISGNSSSYCTVSNCIVNFIGGSGATGTNDNYTGIVLNGGSANIYTQAQFSNLTIDSNIITGGNSGIYLYGQNSDNINIRNNTITNANMYGIYAYYMMLFRFNNNNINMRPTGNTSSIGMYINFPISIGSYGKEIIGNVINDAGQYGIYAYYMQGGAGALRSKIINNAIGGNFRSMDPAGIYCYYYCTNIDILFNSINITNASTGLTSGALKFANYCTGNIVKNNNIAVNNPNSQAYALWSDNTSSSFSALNYNNYYKPVPTKLLSINGTIFNTSSMIGGAGLNLNSISVNPNFVSDTNLRSNLTCNFGETISGVTTDLLGNTRNNPPSIGAYETTSKVSNDLAVIGILSPSVPMTVGTHNIQVLVTNNGNNTISSANVSYSVNGGTPATIAWTGTLNACDTAIIEFNATSGIGSTDQRYSFLPGITYVIKAYSSLPNGSTDLNVLNDTISVGPICGSLAGSYTIDNTLPASVSNFVSFSSAAQALGCAGITAPVIFNVAAGTYNERIELSGEIIGASSTNTITFDGGAGNDSTRILNYSSTASAMRSTFVFNNTGFISLRNMTIRASGASYGWAVHVYGNSHDITIANCILDLAGSAYNGTSTNHIGFVMSGSITSPTSSSNAYTINILNSKLVGGYANTYISGSGSNNNIVFDGNILTNAYTYGVYASNLIGAKFNNNKIYCRTTNNSSYGMFLNSLVTNNSAIAEVKKNKIFDAGLYGIYISNSNATSNRAELSNNSVGGLFRSAAPSGIYFTSSNNWNIWFNSVLIANSASSSTSTAAIYLNSGTGFDFRNNNMAVTDSTSGADYLPFRSTVSVTFTPALDYNNYYKAGTPTNLINVGGTNYTPINYKTGGGNNSVSNSSGYTSGNELIPTLANNNGIQITGINEDVNGTLRNNPPDIGSYEIASTDTLDLGIASIASPSLNIAAGSNDVNVLIKNFGTNTIHSFSLRHTVNGLNQIDTTFTGLNLTTNDTIRIILTGNKAALISAGVLSTFKVYLHQPNGNADNNRANDTITIGPINASLKGIYTINPSGSGVNNFVSFRAATNALHSAGVSGNVTFIVAPGTYNEQISLNAINGVSATNTVTFDGVSAANRIIDTAANTVSNYWTIKLNNSPYITFKNLTINASGTNYGVAVQIAGASDYTQIIKCKLNVPNSLTSTGSSFAPLILSNTSSGSNLSTSVRLNNLVIDSNTISGGYYGILMYGLTSSPYSTNNVISNNTITDAYYYGIYAYYHEALTINGNTISNRTVNGNTNAFGIYLTSCYNNLANTKHEINNNKIVNIGRYGIYAVNGGGATSSNITNNMIGGGFNSTAAFGAYFSSFQGLNFVHNSIYIDANTTNSSNSSLYLAYNTNSTIRNNILANTGSGFPLYINGNQNGSFDLDANNYYRFGAGSSYDIIYNNGTTYNTTNYKGAGGYNANAVNINPDFVSTTNLHLTSACAGRVPRLSYVMNDIDGDMRPATTNMGADEVSALTNDAGIASILPFTVGTQDVKVVLQNFGSNVITSANVAYSVNGSIPKIISWSGTLNPCDTALVVFSGINQYNFLSGVTYTVTAYTSSPNLTTDSKLSNDTAILGPTCVFLSGSYTINASGSGSRNFTSFNQAITALTCGGINGPVTFNVAPGTYNEQIVLGNILGSSSINTITFKGDSLATCILTYNPTINTSAFTVKFENSKNIIFENLTIQAGGTSGFAGVVQIANNCSNIQVSKNILEITGNGLTATTQTYFPIIISGTTSISSVYVQCTGTSDINIDSNRLVGGYASIFVYSSSSPYLNNLNIRGNTMDSAYYFGTYIFYTAKTNIENNMIRMRVVGNNNSYGMYLYNMNASNPDFHTVSGNQVYNSGMYGIYGYFASTNSSLARSKMFNNAIGGNFRSAQATPLFMQYSYYWDIWNNTAVLDYNTSAAQYSAASFMNCNLMDVRNNHFVNNAIGGSGLPFYAAAANQFTALDYNNYYNNAGSNIASIGGANYTASTIINGNGFNANAKSINPGFVSAFNLAASNGCINGVSIPFITKDINNTIRNTPPDIGAYEFAGTINNDLGISALVSPSTPFSSGSYPIKVRINNYGTNTITSATIKYSINNGTPVSYSYSGTLAPCDTTTLTISPSNVTFNIGSTYSIKVWSEAPNAQVDGNRLNDTIQVGMCAALSAGTYTINPSGSGSTNFTSFTDAANVLNCGGVSGPVKFIVSPGTYSEQIVLSNIQGVSSTNTITFDGVDKNTRTIQYNATNTMEAHTIRILNTPYVTIKNLTILSLGSSYGSPIHIMGTSDSTRITNNNISFTSGASSTSSYFIGVLVNNEANITNPSLNGTKANNIQIDSNTITYGYYGIFAFGFTSSPYAQGLVINNNTIDSAYYYGAYLYYLSGVNVNANKVNMRSGNANSQALSFNQLYNNGNAYHTINGNKIKGAGRYGMYLYFSSNQSSYRGSLINNSIEGGFSSTAANGIYMAYSSYWDIWNNSVWLDYPTSSNQYSAFSAVNSSNYLDIRNNHFVYSPNTGSGLSMYSTPSSSTINYNNYYTGSGTILLYANANYTSSTFINGGGYNANSLNINPNFTPNSMSTGGCFTGIAIPAVTKDINNKTRKNPPTIGAYEASLLDVSVVAIVSPSQPVTAGTQNVVVAIKNTGDTTITSVTVTYNVNNTGNVSVQFTGLSIAPCSTANVTFTGVNQYTFPAGRSLIKVYTSNPNGLLDEDRTNDTLTSSLCGALSGNYTINPTLNSPSNFKSFNEAITTMQCAGISGPVVFEVATGEYNEQVTIPNISGASPFNTITFSGNPNKVDSTILTFASTNSNARHTLKFDASEYVNVEYLTIRTTGDIYGWGTHFASNTQYCTLKGCKIEIGGTTAPTSTSANFVGIALSGSNTSPTSSGNFRDLTIDSNTIINGYYGITLYGNTSSTDSNLVITNNTLTNTYYYGIYVYSVEGMQINSNKLSLRTDNQNSYGMYITSSTAYSPFTSFEINANRIINTGAYGIFISSANGYAGQRALLINNMIGGGFSSTGARGLYMSSSSNWDIYHNSINLDASTSSVTSATAYFSGGTNNRMKNNHLAYTATGGQGLTLYATSTIFASGGVDFNNYYKVGITPTADLLYLSGYFSPTTYKGGSGFNQNSFNKIPGFRSNLNLATIDGCFNGDSLGVLTDIDGDLRGTHGDIGADEVSDANNDLGIVALLQPSIPLTPGLKDISVLVKNFGTNTVYKGTVNYVVNGGTPVSLIFNDTIQPCDTMTITFTGSQQFNFQSGVNYSILAYTTLPNDSIDINNVNDTVYAPNLCMSMAGNYTINPNGSGPNNFTSFQSALNALACSGVAAPVVFTVDSGVYNEQLTIPAILGTSPTNTVTFDGGNGNVSTRILTYGATTTNNRHTIKFSGAQYVEFRNLTIQNSGTSWAWPVHVFSGSKNIRLSKNKIEIIGAGATTSNTNFINVVVSSSVTSPYGIIRVDSLTIDSNSINGGYASVFSYNQQSLYNNFNGNTFNNPLMYGLYIYNAYELRFRNNTVNMSSTGDLNSVGLYLYILGNSGTTSHDISGNTIKNSGMYGVYLYNSFSSPSYRGKLINNFIGGGFRNTTQHAGIYSDYSYYWDIWFNTIKLDTICTSQVGAIQIQNSNSLDVRNNIFAVTHPLSSALPYYSTSTANTSQLDYNNYYKAGNNSTLIYNGIALSPSTFIGYSGSNTNSITKDPMFVNATDLHVTNGCNNGVTIAGVTTDIDGNTRSTPPDMGADEVTTGFSNNLSATAILSPSLPLNNGTQNIVVQVTNLGNNLVTSANVSYSVNGGTPVTVSITDSILPCGNISVTFSGVNAYSFAQGTSYSIKAYTSLPNGVPDNNTADDTTTLGPICPAMSGNYTIDPAGSGATNFTTIAAALDALQCAGINNSVVFNIANGTYTEQIDIAPIVGTNDTTTVTFKGQSKNGVILTYSSSDMNKAHTMKINGASNIIIRDLTIQNAGSSMGVPLHIFGTTNNVRIVNNKIVISGAGASSTSSSYSGIIINAYTNVNSPTSGTGAFANNLDIDSNTIIGGYYGIVAYGRTNSPYSNIINFRYNDIDSSYSNGIYTYYLSGLQISNNNINMRVLGSTNSYGLYMYFCYNNSGYKHQVFNNRIYDAGGYGTYIYYSSGVNAATPSEYYNNMVGGKFRYFNASAAYFQSSNNWNVYHNSLHMNYQTNNIAYSTFYATSSTNLKIANNIFIYASTSGTGLPFYSTSAQPLINNNNYVKAGSTNLLYVNGTTYTTTNYINGGGYNANSYSTLPGFVSDRNLNLTAATVKGASNLGISRDIDWQLRQTPPDLGADEYYGVMDIGIVSIDSPTTSTTCGGNKNIIVRMKNYGNQTITTAVINYIINGTQAGSYNWSGSLSGGQTSGPINIGTYAFTSGNFDLSVATSLPNYVTDTIVSNDSAHTAFSTILTVNPAITLTPSQTSICTGQQVTIIATYNDGGTSPALQWRKNGITIPFTGDTLVSTSFNNNDSIVVILTSSSQCAVPVNAISNSVVMNVGSTVPAMVSITASDTAICNGQNMSFTAVQTNGGSTPTYKWYKNGTYVSDSITYTAVNPTNGDSIAVILQSSLGCATPPTDTAWHIINVKPLLLPTVSINASATTFCAGTQVKFTASSTNQGTSPSYQWMRNGVNIGGNSDSLIVSTLTNQDSIHVILTSNAMCATPTTATSNKIQVTVNPIITPSVSISSNSSNICVGSKVDFTAQLVNAGNGAKYNWKLNGILVDSTAAFSSTTLSNGDTISLTIMTDTICANPDTIHSNTIVMQVNSYVTPSVSFTSSADTVCSGSSVTFTATPVNGGTTPSYQWKINGTNVGTDSSVFSTIFSHGDSVTVVMTSSNMCVTQNPVTTTYKTIAINSLAYTDVVIQASSLSICEGNAVTFYATPTNGGNHPNYQWKLNGVNIGNNTDSLYLTNLANGDSVQVILTSNAVCPTPAVKPSNKLGITVTPLVTPTVNLVASNTEVCSGDTVTFTASTTNAGTSPSYKWFKNGVIVATVDSVYKTKQITSTDSIWVEVTSSITCVTVQTVTSNKVKVMVNSLASPSVTISSSQTITCAGSPITFTASATDTGSLPTYQWKVNGVNAGSNNSIFTTSSLNNNDSVWVVVTSSATCATNPTATSNKVGIQITSPVTPKVTVSVSSTSICAGTLVTYTATATNAGTSPIFAWYKNGLPVGANSNVYASDSLIDGDQVFCIMTATSGCLTKSGDTAYTQAILVKTPPVKPIIVRPSTDSLTTQFASLNYQWFKNGTAISGANKRGLKLTENASYYVRVDSLGCSNTSEPIIISDMPVGLKEINSIRYVNVYPNPTNGNATVVATFSNLKTTTIVVTDMFGRLISSVEVGNKTSMSETIDLSKLADGVYFITVQHGTDKLTHRIVKAD